MNVTPLVTTRQAAMHAQVKPATIRRWVYEGLLTPVACHVASRSSVFPLAAVMRAERATRENGAKRPAA